MSNPMLFNVLMMKSWQSEVSLSAMSTLKDTGVRVRDIHGLGDEARKVSGRVKSRKRRLNSKKQSTQSSDLSRLTLNTLWVASLGLITS